MEQSGMRNMTEGSPARHIFFFALPMFLGSLLQQLYNMVDSWVVGNYVGDAALAAVGIGFPVIFMFTSLFTGMANGGTVVISQFYGAGKMDRVRDAVDTVYTTFVVSAIPLTLLALALVKPLLSLLQVDPAAYDEAWLYLMIVCGGLVGTIGYNTNAGILQGLGNSRTPLLFLAIAAVMNIVLDLALVLIFHWGVMGVAVATIFSQAFSWIFGVLYINRVYPQIGIHPFCFRFDRQLFGDVMRIGLPAGVQMAMVSVGMMLVMGKVNTYGKAFTAGYNVGNKLDAVAFLPVQSLSNAVTAYVGQNIGAGASEGRVHQGIRVTVAMGVGWCLAMLALLMPFRNELVGFFSPSAEVVSAGAVYLKSILPFYPLFAVMFCLNNAMRGAGESMFPLICVVFSLILVRVPAVYLLAEHAGREMMFYGFGVGWAVGFAVSVIYYFAGRWKRHGSLAS
ncbi:MATE family efflux transporter [Oscillibacter hominis]|uniref:Probable multidrug resistance protein NorM n=1 Tax=Oscillibacter hominis TaxID=2763056 RepID=A0A7G9B3N0_9FIRM|nr:MATE family efflux transporter [Oscillibacter hominis]QNL44161.1 MATE family efflux transporter [Oscillibacter hominis]